MKRILLFVVLVVLDVPAGAACKASLPLAGIESIKTCDRKTERCVDAWRAVGEYAEKIDGSDDPAVLNLIGDASPWRFYDGDARIITVDEMAGLIKPQLGKSIKRVALVASWSAVRPDPHTPSLKERIAKALGGFPVTGADGFLWFARDGKIRTTRQVATIMLGGRYEIAEGGEVFVSLATGWPAHFVESLVKEKNADGILRAGAGLDVYMLCPERALQAFEYAAQLGQPIAAYNAALMRLERGAPGDLEAAKALLTRASNAGDQKAQKHLQLLPKTEK